MEPSWRIQHQYMNSSPRPKCHGTRETISKNHVVRPPRRRYRRVEGISPMAIMITVALVAAILNHSSGENHNQDDNSDTGIKGQQQQQQQQQQLKNNTDGNATLSGWTEVTKKWPKGAESFFVATKDGHHFIRTSLPGDVIKRKSKIEVKIIYFYSYRNVKPVVNFVACSESQDLGDSILRPNTWAPFTKIIETSKCVKRDRVAFDVLLHDTGDVFAWQSITLKELEVSPERIPEVSTERIPEVSTERIPEVSTERIPEVSTERIPEVSTERIPEDSTGTKKDDSNQNSNLDTTDENKSASDAGGSEGGIRNRRDTSGVHSPHLPIFVSLCNPKHCDKKQIKMARFRPILNGIPRNNEQILENKPYFINNDKEELKVKINTREDVSLHDVDVCLDMKVYLDRGTKLIIQYPNPAFEDHAATQTATTTEFSPIAESSEVRLQDSKSPVPTGDSHSKVEDRQTNDTKGKQKVGATTDPQAPIEHNIVPNATTDEASAPATASPQPNVQDQSQTQAKTDRINKASMITITTLEPQKKEPSWIKRKVCISDHLPRLPPGNGKKELLLVPIASPNQIVGVQFNPVSIRNQLASREFLPNLNQMASADLEDYWQPKQEGGDPPRMILEDLSSDVPSTSDNTPDRNVKLKFTDINQQQESFDLVSRWLKVGDNENSKKIKFNYKIKYEDWIKAIDVGLQRAGDSSWEMTNVFQANQAINKDEVDMPIWIEDAGTEEFRIMTRHNISEEAQASLQPLSINILTLALADPCIDKSFCQNKGICKPMGTGQAKCECLTGYTGDKCEHVNPCEVLYNGRTGEEVCTSIEAQCVKNIPVFRCRWPNDQYLRCSSTIDEVSSGGSQNELGTSNQQDAQNGTVKELSQQEMKAKLAEQSKMIIIMGSLMAGFTLFAIVIVGNLVMRLLSAKKRIKSAEEAREMSLRTSAASAPPPRIPKYGRPSGPSFNNQAFDD